MLGYLLAVLVGTGSVGLYVAAFFFPEIHRKPDFIWGGVGLFYALALWIYAKEISGGMLVGQAASVALLGWFGWQTIKLRQLVPLDWQTTVPTSKKPEWTRTKAATSTETKDPQPAVKKPTGSRAATPTIDPQSPPPAPVEPTPKSTTDRRDTSVPKSSPKPAPSNPVVRVEANAAPVHQPPATAKVTEPPIEPEEEAWIRLEVKPAPDSASLVKEVVRSTPPTKPQPTSEQIQPPQQSRQPSAAPPPPQVPASPTPPPLSSQPTPAVQPPPPPPAKSQPIQPPAVPIVKPEPVTEVITVSVPSPTERSSTQRSAPPSPPPATTPQPAVAAPTPQPETTTPPAPTAKKDAPQETLDNRELPLEQTGDLDKLIAELESEI
jgi:hypothetical protein